LLADGADSAELSESQEILEEWAELFLLVQRLNKAARHTEQPLFHEEFGKQPLVISGRATIWPAELKPL